MHATEFEREMSSGHFVSMNRFRIILTNACEWSHDHEESEWSLMTSLIRPLFAQRDMPQDAHSVEFVGRVLRDVIENCANRRNPGGAMSHGGSFDRLAESFAWDGESTMHAYFPMPI